MKRNIKTIIGASAVSVLTFSALAQSTTNPKVDGPDYTHSLMRQAQRADRLNGAAKASDLIGMTVNNYQNEKLGKVEDLAVDVESGRIVQVILSTGGFLGIGDTLTAVPPGALHHDAANKVLHLDADKEKLKAAPVFEMSNWAAHSDSDHLKRVYGHYGQEPAFVFIQNGGISADGQRSTDPLSVTDRQRYTANQLKTNDSPNTVSIRRADGTWDKDRIATDTMIPVSRLSQIQKASKLMGTPVNNLQDEKLGKVENILVDLPSGRVVAVIVASGGFLGMGDELSAVPPTALRFTSDRETLQLDATKELLSSSPHFKANEWPDFAQPSYANGVYRAYRVDPYFTTNATTDLDNRAFTARDRSTNALTPLDQGNSKADVSTTAQIRKEILAGKEMSLNAKNVKIITINGQVTLRGRVNSEEEKRLIGKIADRIARSGNVNNQLEVNLTTSSTN
jgi:sporulation protein YlmC with PRC-barrel domain